jgi:hypothetical protein
MNYIGALVSSFLFIIHLLRLIKMHFNPRILRSKYFDPPLTKFYITMYYIITMFFLLILTLNRLRLIEL